MEQYDFSRQDIEDFIKELPILEVRESFDDFQKNQSFGILKIPTKRLGPLPLLEATLDEFQSSMYLDGGIENLLEKLLIKDILLTDKTNRSLTGDSLTTTTLEYYYDFGDGWTVYITRPDDTDYLIDQHLATPEEIKTAIEKVKSTYRPSILSRQGLNVLDDVGGLSGFSRMLKSIYEEDDPKEASEFRAWSKSMGWSSYKTTIYKTL